MTPGLMDPVGLLVHIYTTDVFTAALSIILQSNTNGRL